MGMAEAVQAQAAHERRVGRAMFSLMLVSGDSGSPALCQLEQCSLAHQKQLAPTIWRSTRCLNCHDEFS